MALALGVSSVVAAGDWLSAMPSPADVRASITGSDPSDTAARRFVVFESLQELSFRLAERYGTAELSEQGTPAFDRQDEFDLFSAYGAAAAETESDLIRSLPPVDQPVVDPMLLETLLEEPPGFFTDANFRQFKDRIGLPPDIVSLVWNQAKEAVRSGKVPGAGYEDWWSLANRYWDDPDFASQTRTKLFSTDFAAADGRDFMVGAGWVSVLPTAAAVEQATQGSDALDSAARRYAVLAHLTDLVNDVFAIDLWASAKKAPAHNAQVDVYRTAADETKTLVLAGLPADQQLAQIGTQYGNWIQQVNNYAADAAFGESMATTLLPAEIRASDPARAAWRREGGVLPPPLAVLRPDNLGTWVPWITEEAWPGLKQLLAQWGLVLVAIVAAAAGSVGKSSRLALDPQDPFRLLKGESTVYRINHVTGFVENAQSNTSTTTYYKGASVWSDALGNIRSDPGYMYSDTTTTDKFFVRSRDGSLDHFSLVDWGVPLANGSLVSVVWAILEGKSSGPVFAVYNHDLDTRYGYLKASTVPEGDATINRYDVQGVAILIALGITIGLSFLVGDYASVGFLLFPGLIQGLVVAAVFFGLAMATTEDDLWKKALTRFRFDELPRLDDTLTSEAAELRQSR